MSNKLKDISIKNHTHCFFNNITNIKSFDPYNIKIDQKSYKNIFVSYIGYEKFEICKNSQCKSFLLYFQ